MKMANIAAVFDFMFSQPRGKDGVSRLCPMSCSCSICLMCVCVHLRSSGVMLRRDLFHVV